MNVYICSAARTAIGTYGGTLRDVPAAQLGVVAANAAIERAGVDKEAIDEVMFGQDVYKRQVISTAIMCW